MSFANFTVCEICRWYFKALKGTVCLSTDYFIVLLAFIYKLCVHEHAMCVFCVIAACCFLQGAYLATFFCTFVSFSHCTLKAV